MRIQGVRRKLYRAAYDKPGVQKMALRFRRSMDDVKKLLEENGKKVK